MRKINKGDTVKIMRGKDAGKEGEVLMVLNPKSEKKNKRVVVKGINVVKKSQKPNPQFGITGGIVEFEKPIDISNVMLVSDGKATRVGIETKENKKYRISKKTGKKI